MTDALVAFPQAGAVTGLRVFLHAPHGGNPVPLVADARGLSAPEMQAVAARHGHESAFVLPATVPGADWRLRFFVPQHEMEMCGHATVGALWALRRWGAWTAPTAVVQTLSGLVDARWDDAEERVWVSQPRAVHAALAPQHASLVARTLGLAAAVPMVNAATSRVKTLVRLPSVAALQALAPDFAAIASVCEAIGSTGLYPYAFDEGAASVLHARQFPKASGYPEDAATGIAAAALWGYLQAMGEIGAGSAAHPAACVVRQGDAMGLPSAIAVRARFDATGAVAGCWLSGQVDWMAL